ncbi:MAG TPA: alpha/beta hydrolase [Gaiellaceae bacterium]|nr:alpha/beta hydrolase [Gaiellaceae bacterium]
MGRDSRDILTDPPPPAADARLAYGEQPLQFGDLRLPEGRGPCPLAVVVHGGYWQATYNLIHTGHVCVALAEAGIATWNVEYRRLGDIGGGWPGTGADVARAIAFVGELPVEHESVVLVGHSAGGQLVLWAAKRARLPVLALAAISDVRDSVARTGPDGMPARFVGGNRFEELSPIELLPLGVRQILIHGTDDDSVPYAMSRRYVEAAGDEAELVTLAGAGHFEPIDPQSREWPQVVAAVRSLCTERVA